MNYYDSNRDPANSNAIAGAFYWMSLGSTGTTIASATTTFDNLVIPESPNFPPDGSTMTRYFINLPGEPYYTDIVAGNSTFVIKNINTSTVLTRVPPRTALTANTYKIFDESQNRRGCFEIHVGVGSNQPADRIAFHGRFITSMLGSTHFQRIEDYFTSKDKIVGITMTNSTSDSDHDIYFGSGYVYNEIETRRLTMPALTKKFDSTFGLGSSAGILVDTTAISASADYYIYAIGKNNYSSAADYVASTNSSYPSYPTTDWTNYTKIGVARTDTSANLIQGIWRREYNWLLFEGTTFYSYPIGNNFSGSSTMFEYQLYFNYPSSLGGKGTTFTSTMIYNKQINAPIGSYANIDILFIGTTIGAGGAIDYISYGNLSEVLNSSVADIYSCRERVPLGEYSNIKRINYYMQDSYLYLRHYNISGSGNVLINYILHYKDWKYPL